MLVVVTLTRTTTFSYIVEADDRKSAERLVRERGVTAIDLDIIEETETVKAVADDDWE